MPILKLYVLTREVSPYLGPMQLLGVFSSLDEVEKAKTQYLAPLLAGTRPDPWGKQPYQKVDLEHDVRIDSGWEVDIPGQDQRVYVVTRSTDGMGQITRNIVTLKGDESQAELIASDLETSNAKESLHYEYMVEDVAIGELLADNQE